MYVMKCLQAFKYELMPNGEPAGKFDIRPACHAGGLDAGGTTQ
jgi:hypothetical protein